MLRSQIQSHLDILWLVQVTGFFGTSPGIAHQRVSLVVRSGKHRPRRRGVMVLGPFVAFNINLISSAYSAPRPTPKAYTESEATLLANSFACEMASLVWYESSRPSVSMATTQSHSSYPLLSMALTWRKGDAMFVPPFIRLMLLMLSFRFPVQAREGRISSRVSLLNCKTAYCREQHREGLASKSLNKINAFALEVQACAHGTRTTYLP